MVHVDLDAARADRAAARAAMDEGRGADPVITLGGREYVLVPELPLSFYEFLARDRPRLAAAILLAHPEDLEPFMGNEPTMDDLGEISRLYGFRSLGESRASGRSSNGTGSTSRPTSKRTTDSTSGRAGAKKPR